MTTTNRHTASSARRRPPPGVAPRRAARRAPLLLGLVAALAACAEQSRTVRVDGSTGVMPLVTQLADGFHESREGVAIEFGGGLGSGARIRALADGEIDIALASHGLVAEEIDRQGLAVHEIARGAIVFAVHSSVPLPGLTRGQICDVYRGTPANWRELGGPDLRIVPHMRPESEVDAEVVLEKVDCWKDLRLAGTVDVIEQPADMAEAIATTPGAIGLTTMTLVEQSGGRIRPLSLDGVEPTAENVRSGSYDLTREFYLVTQGSPSDAVSSFLEFVRSPAGAEVILANGAIPTR